MTIFDNPHKRSRNSLGRFTSNPRYIKEGWKDYARRAGPGLVAGAAQYFYNRYASQYLEGTGVNQRFLPDPGSNNSTQIPTSTGEKIVQGTPNTEYKDTIKGHVKVGRPVKPLDPLYWLNIISRPHRFESQNSFKASATPGTSSCSWIFHRTLMENLVTTGPPAYHVSDVQKGTSSSFPVLPHSKFTASVTGAGGSNNYDRSGIVQMGNTIELNKVMTQLINYSNLINSNVQNWFPARTNQYNLPEFNPLILDNTAAPIHFDSGTFDFRITNLSNHPVFHEIYMFSVNTDFCNFMQRYTSQPYSIDLIWNELIVLFEKKYFSDAPNIPVFGNQNGAWTARADLTAEDYVNKAGPIPKKFLKFISEMGLNVIKTFEVTTKAGQRTDSHWNIGGLHVSPKQYSFQPDSSGVLPNNAYQRFDYMFPGSTFFMHRSWGPRMAANTAVDGTGVDVGTIESGVGSIIDYKQVEFMSMVPCIIPAKINAMTGSPELMANNIHEVMNPPVTVNQGHLGKGILATQ